MMTMTIESAMAVPPVRFPAGLNVCPSTAFPCKSLSHSLILKKFHIKILYALTASKLKKRKNIYRKWVFSLLSIFLHFVGVRTEYVSLLIFVNVFFINCRFSFNVELKVCSRKAPHILPTLSLWRFQCAVVVNTILYSSYYYRATWIGLMDE